MEVHMTNRFSTTGCSARCSAISAVLAAISLLCALPTPAKAQPGSSFTVVPLNTTPFGMSYGEWSARWWQWAFALPFNIGPFNWPNLATPDCGVGQFGPVWFLAGFSPSPGPVAVTCHVPAGKALFLPIVNNECSSLEDFPYDGDSPRERRQCAQADTDSNPPVRLEASVDGHNISNLTSYRAQSPDFWFVIPPPTKLLGGNILGYPTAAIGQSSSDGYYLMVVLSPGTHTIHIAADIENTRVNSFKIDTTYKVIVDH
jgi:hypothetical protein